MKKVVLSVILLIAVAGAALGIAYKNAADTENLPSISVNGTQIAPVSGQYRAYFVPDFLPQGIKDIFSRQVSFSADSIPDVIQTDKTSCDIQSPSGFDLTLKYNDDKSVYTYTDCEILDIPLRGRAEAEIIMDWNGGSLTYRFTLQTTGQPAVALSDSRPVQGGLVKVEISDIFANDEININSPVFSPSGITRDRRTHSARFYLPITYYQPAKQYPVSVDVGGQVFDFVLDVQRYDFSTISFTMDRQTSAQTVESRRANSEYRRLIHPLYYTKEETVYWDGSMIKPVQERRISSEFGQIRYINNSTVPERHSGIDYAAALGTPVYAPAAGKVDFAGFLQLSGNTVVIDHGLGVKSYFFHMDDVSVTAGDVVRQQQLIGHVGTTGYSTGPHLHFQVSIENQPVNPELLYK